MKKNIKLHINTVCFFFFTAKQVINWAAEPERSLTEISVYLVNTRRIRSKASFCTLCFLEIFESKFHSTTVSETHTILSMKQHVNRHFDVIKKIITRV